MLSEGNTKILTPHSPSKPKCTLVRLLPVRSFLQWWASAGMLATLLEAVGLQDAPRRPFIPVAAQ
eukprot:2599825-Amphidinium_carterae.2